MIKKRAILSGICLLAVSILTTAKPLSNLPTFSTPADTVKNLFQLPGNPYPALPVSVNRLFYVQRTPNANTIVYELNMSSNGQPNEDEPIHAYWIRYHEQGQKADLSYIQRKFAYGLNTKSLGNGKYDIRFVSYKKYPLTLMKGTDGKYHIFATISQRLLILNRVFVKIEGGSFWVPKVLFVELRGTDQSTGKEYIERFKP
ncbi:DUF4833 domain-containing protein [Mucilaginibacter robiniae]|uniref:DUF4833 domain-containing protein n=1 Tax=Mucilaginibacter robiniae TaxID=2728022 RepID=A0A7L5E5A7_9SPHI|nr:DUF4833 domain-containing protein [Mucilaginibacter robiniae]QJD97808.1 DUF4833 domain-containing protein [Mucilaginibacter robiniae]